MIERWRCGRYFCKQVHETIESATVCKHPAIKPVRMWQCRGCDELNEMMFKYCPACHLKREPTEKRL